MISRIIPLIRPLALLAFASALAPAQAANLLQGNREIGVSGLVDFDTVDDTLIDLSLQYGVLLRDALEAGGRVGIRDSDSATLWSLGGFIEYNFLGETEWVPFVGTGVAITSSDVNDRSDETGVGLNLTGGTKYFLSDSVALTTALTFEWATDDVFPTDDGAEDTNWDIEIGMRFYF